MLATLDPFERLRATEFARLDDQDIAYLDYTGAALYGASQAAAVSRLLARGLYGNPHSAHTPSKTSERALEKARAATLAWLDADPDQYVVCFTANASAALKLVGESYPFGPDRGLVLSADNHNSVNGIREFARRADAPVGVLPLTDELRLDDPAARLADFAAKHGPGLLAFPVQSNFSGVRHPLELAARGEAQGFDVLIDAAGAGLCGGLSLRRHPVAFLALSFYKIFGLPTGVGALVARRDALAKLRRPWFAGGTVDYVSIEHDRHQLSRGAAGFEDGTPNFLDIAALQAGFEFVGEIDLPRLQQRLLAMTTGFIEAARALRHANGAPKVAIHGPADGRERGGVIAFNLLRPDGAVIPYQVVEAAAQAAGVALRGGCFCNPGAAEAAFGFSEHAMAAHLDALGADFTIPRLQARLGPLAAAGALRVSVGLPTVQADLDRALAVLAET